MLESIKRIIITSAFIWFAILALMLAVNIK